MEEIYTLIEQRLSQIEEVQGRYKKIVDQQNNAPQGKAAKNSETQDLLHYINQQKRNDKLRVIKENELMEMIFSLRSFDNNQKLRFQEKSYEIMKRLKKDFSYDKYKPTGDTKDVAKVYLNFFLVMKMQTRIDDLKRAYANNKFIGYPIVSILLKWLIEIGRKHFQTVLKDKADEIQALNIQKLQRQIVPQQKIKEPQQTTDNASDSTASGSNTTQSNVTNQAINNIGGIGNVKIQGNSIQTQKDLSIIKVNNNNNNNANKCDESDSRKDSMDFTPINSARMRTLDSKADQFLKNGESSQSATKSNQSEDFTSAVQNFNTSCRNLRIQKLFPKSNVGPNTYPIHVQNSGNPNSHLEPLDDLDSSNISGFHAALHLNRNSRKTQNNNNNIILIDVDKKKDLMNSVYKNLYNKNSEVERTINNFKLKSYEKNKIQTEPSMKRGECYLENYNMDFAKRFSHLIAYTALPHSPDFRGKKDIYNQSKSTNFSSKRAQAPSQSQNNPNNTSNLTNVSTNNTRIKTEANLDNNAANNTTIVNNTSTILQNQSNNASMISVYQNPSTSSALTSAFNSQINLPDEGQLEPPTTNSNLIQKTEENLPSSILNVESKNQRTITQIGTDSTQIAPAISNIITNNNNNNNNATTAKPENQFRIVTKKMPSLHDVNRDEGKAQQRNQSSTKDDKLPHIEQGNNNAQSTESGQQYTAKFGIGTKKINSHGNSISVAPSESRGKRKHKNRKNVASYLTNVTNNSNNNNNTNNPPTNNSSTTKEKSSDQKSTQQVQQGLEKNRSASVTKFRPTQPAQPNIQWERVNTLRKSAHDPQQFQQESMVSYTGNNKNALIFNNNVNNASSSNHFNPNSQSNYTQEVGGGNNNGGTSNVLKKGDLAILQKNSYSKNIKITDLMLRSAVQKSCSSPRNDENKLNSSYGMNQNAAQNIMKQTFSGFPVQKFENPYMIGKRQTAINGPSQLVSLERGSEQKTKTNGGGFKIAQKKRKNSLSYERPLTETGWRVNHNEDFVPLGVSNEEQQGGGNFERYGRNPNEYAQEFTKIKNEFAYRNG